MSALLLCLSTLIHAVNAHDHDEVSDEDLQKPVDFLLWLHIAIQLTVWGVLFPAGMVLGLIRQRLHVPIQLLGFILTAAGFVLGHTHGGRQFNPSAHEKLASVLLFPIFSQLLLGVYLKLHIHEGSFFRHYCVKAHSILGFTYPILGWIQILLGFVVLQDYCRGDNIGQCLAHYIMGSSFVAYGVVMAILLMCGREWLTRTKKSPEWWDSWIIMLWGMVNTFTEHRGNKWSPKDMQHTSLGLLWWSGGLLGIWSARRGKRSIVPSIVIVLTGWAMSFHSQATMTSTNLHRSFGLTLGAAGVARALEITFILSDLSTAIVPFRHLPPLLLIAAGLLFMSATDEELKFVDDIGMDSVTYTLIIFSVSFLIYFLVNVLLHIYETTGRNSKLSPSDTRGIDYQPLGHDDNFEPVVDARDVYQISSTMLSPSDGDEEK